MEKGFNEHEIKGDEVLVYIKEYVVKIDKKDLEEVSKYRWFISSKPIYPYTDIWNKKTKSVKRIRLHKFLMGDNGKLFTDHINGDKLDNRRSNLRFVTRAFNTMNRIPKKGHLGYCKTKYSKTSRHRKLYLVQWIDGGKRYQKRFMTEKEAILCRIEEDVKRMGFSQYQKVFDDLYS